MRGRSRLSSGALVLALMAVLAFMGCSTTEADDSVVLEPHCNPLSTDSCMPPWPSTFYLAQDAASRTGYRVAYPAKAMPQNRDGVPIDPTRYNYLDGFPVGSQIVVYFKAGVEASDLPGIDDDLADSITDKSRIWIVEDPTGERVPLFAELDANVKPNEIPALLIRPQSPLKFNTRYVVVLRRGIRDRGGVALEPPEPFARLRDDRGTINPALESERPRMAQVLDFLETQSVSRGDLLLAWDFHTASREAITGNVLGMVDEALSRLPIAGPGFTVVKATDFDSAEDPEILREVQGEMEVPSYFASDGVDSWLKLDNAGKPVLRGTQTFPFWVHIPRCAETATQPLPVLIFGPGLFADPWQEFSKDYNKKMANRLCMVEFTARWRGLSSLDAAAVAAQVIPDFSNLPRITDPLQQAHVNMQVLTELAHGDFTKDASMQVGGKAATDGQQIYYLGISNGGIQGVAFAALSQRIERFVLHVAGGWWSMMMSRSSNFGLLGVLLEQVYRDPVERQLLLSLTQHLWEYTDPISFSGNLLGTPLSGRKTKRVVIQESLNDDQVPNIATRAVARGVGLPQLTPVVESIYGLTQKAGPLDSGLAQWDTKPPTKPSGQNIPASKPPESESAHLRVRQLETFLKQVEAFLKPDGKLVHVCSGPCDPD